MHEDGKAKGPEGAGKIFKPNNFNIIYTVSVTVNLFLQVANKVVKGVHTDVINYEKPGRMILAQGSEVLHHVTPVLSKSRRFRNQHDFDTFFLNSIHYSIAGFP